MLIFTPVRSRENGVMPNWIKDTFCGQAKGGYSMIPWDCSGYLHCSNAHLGPARWINCPPGLSFDMSSRTCEWDSESCNAAKMAQVASKWCVKFPQLVFDHPGSCALFYNCSRGSGTTPKAGLLLYEDECKYPTLFDPASGGCRENSATCRNKPARCDYVTECSRSVDPCATLANGGHPAPGTPFSKHYIMCAGGQTLNTLTCDKQGWVFDPEWSVCSNAIQDSINSFCSKNPMARFPDPADCAKSYDCTNPQHQMGLQMFQRECDYMHLYDAGSSSCVMFDKLTVPCGDRFEPRAPCEYKVKDCSQSQYCMPCSASCVGLPDGDVPYPSMRYTRFHLHCRSGRTVAIKECAKGEVFYPEISACSTTTLQLAGNPTASATTRPTYIFPAPATTSTGARPTSMPSLAIAATRDLITAAPPVAPSLTTTTPPTTTPSSTSTTPPTTTPTSTSTTAPTTTPTSTSTALPTTTPTSTSTTPSTTTPTSTSTAPPTTMPTSTSTTPSTTTPTSTSTAPPTTTPTSTSTTPSTTTPTSTSTAPPTTTPTSTSTTPSTTTPTSTSTAPPTITPSITSSSLPTYSPSTTTSSTTEATTTTSSATPANTPPQCGCREELMFMNQSLSNLASDVISITAKLNETPPVPYDCLTPPGVAYATAKISYQHEKAVATYSCFDGYSVCKGGLRSICTGGDVWDQSALGVCLPNTWKNLPAPALVQLTCSPEAGSGLLVKGRYILDKFRLALGNSGTDMVYLFLEVNPSTRDVIVWNEAGLSSTFTSPVPLRGELAWTIGFKDTQFEIFVNGHHMASIPHSADLHLVDKVLIDPGFLSDQVTYFPQGVPKSTQWKEPMVTNIGLNKPSSSSSNSDSVESRRANDGDTNVVWTGNSCWSASEGDPNPWWQVDLVGTYYVSHLVLTSLECKGMCGVRLHDFKIEVFKEDPVSKPGALGVTCHVYGGVFPPQTVQRLDCGFDAVGRYVRVSGVKTGGVSDVMTICEAEVYGGRVQGTGWSPFSCPDPPLLDGAAVQLSYTPAKAIAKYTCQGTDVMCSGNDVLSCSSETGWNSSPGACVKTVLEAGVFGSMSDFAICPLVLGSGIELWATPLQDEESLVLHSETDTVLFMNLTLQATDKPIQLSHLASGALSTAVYPTKNPFVKNKESHIVMTVLSDHLLIEVDGETLYKYLLDEADAHKADFITSTPGFHIRKAKLYNDMIFDVFKDPVPGNLAHNAPVNASTTYSNPASYGVDGNPTRAWEQGSTWHAQTGDGDQWYQVDLGRQYYIRDIKIDINNTCPGCESVNLALNKQAFGNGNNGALSRYDNAVDGDLNAARSGRSCFTSTGDTGWWMVDLGDSYAIDSVALQPPSDGDPDQLSDMTVLVYHTNPETDPSATPTVCRDIPGRIVAFDKIQCVASVSGRFVRLQQMSRVLKSHFTVCEVQVYGLLEDKLHDFSIDVYVNNPLTDKTSPAKPCTQFKGDFPSDGPRTLSCRGDVWGRYVRVKADKIQGKDDLMTIGEVEVYGDKMVKKEWSPLDCPSPPEHPNARVTISRTAREALATYRCVDGFSTCSSVHAHSCSSKEGWVGQVEPCLQTSFSTNSPAGLETVILPCPLKLGEAIEMYVTPQTPGSSVTFLNSRNGDNILKMNMKFTDPEDKFELLTAPMRPAPTIVEVPELPFTPGKESKVVVTYFSDHVDIAVDGKSVYAYPNIMAPHSVDRVITTAGAMRKLSVLPAGDIPTTQRSGPFDCRSPPHRRHATVAVTSTSTSLVAHYSCEAGFSMCGEIKPSTCVGGIWGDLQAHCFKSVWHYSSTGPLYHHNLSCPLSVNSEVRVLATPTENTWFSVQLESAPGKQLMFLESSFTERGYKTSSIKVVDGTTVKDMRKLASFPFQVGKEFELVVKVRRDTMEVFIDGVKVTEMRLKFPLYGVPALETSNLATRRVEYKPSNDITDVIHNTSPTNPWMDVPKHDRTHEIFEVQACNDVLVDLRESEASDKGTTFLIGGRQNTLSQCASCPGNKYTKWHKPLSCYGYRSFWVSWETPGTVSIGMGEMVGVNPIIEDVVTDHNVGLLRVGTNGTDGYWIFGDSDEGHSLSEACPRPEVSPPLKVVRHSHVDSVAITEYSCDENYIFCGESSLSRCEKGVPTSQVQGTCQKNKITSGRGPNTTTMDLPCFMGEGSLISAYITPTNPDNPVEIELSGSSSRSIQLVIDFNARTFSATHSEGGTRGPLETIGSFPFAVNKESHIVIGYEAGAYKIYVDGKLEHTYTSPVSLDKMTHISILQDYHLRDLQAFPKNSPGLSATCSVTTVPSSHVTGSDTTVGSVASLQCVQDYKFCSADDKVTCGKDGQWLVGPDQICKRYRWTNVPKLPMPMLYPPPCLLVDGMAIKLKASTANSFWFDLRAGSEAQLMVEFHVGAAGDSTLTFKTAILNNVLFSKQIMNPPMKVNTLFSLLVEFHADKYAIVLDGIHLYDYLYISPASRTENLIITNGVSITELQFLDTIPPRG
ncbi:uncharacterized protein LOC124144745 [Haliotis rufescens]|uniref:uncharacterized protein LOC124144745 n=1 Tax=Haliotis rufescens TaxID=6454 RepID=UPI00201EE14E|nr:uncharacterized protein LOC124144745 [Haliotis rufescens]